MIQKTLIAVVSCALYPLRRAAVRETWASQPLPPGVDLLFFRGINPVESYSPREPDMLVVAAPDDYVSLPQKTYRIVEYARARYTRVIKVDDDTYLRLPDALEPLSAADCVGSLRADPPHNYYCAYPQGGCYSLSERAMDAVLAQQELFGTGIEDGAVGRALHLHQIDLTHSNRIRTDYRLGQPQPDNDLIAAHHVSPDVMRSIHRHMLTAQGDNSCLPHSQVA